MDTLSLPKSDFGLLTRHLAGLKKDVDDVAARRAVADAPRPKATSVEDRP
jgi:hypothetical protein